MSHFVTLQEFENFYDALKAPVEKSEEAYACFSGIPYPVFNCVMHLRSEKVADKIDELLSKLPVDMPMSFWDHSENRPRLKEELEKRGFQPVLTIPLMTWQVKKVDLPPYRIEKGDMETFLSILATTLQLDQVVKEGYSKLIDNPLIENYILYVNDNPIGVGTVILGKKAGGVFNITILPQYQKRGYGRAMTQFLMNRAGDLGLERLILVSTPVATNLYLGLGFVKCLDIELFVR